MEVCVFICYYIFNLEYYIIYTGIYTLYHPFMPFLHQDRANRARIGTDLFSSYEFALTGRPCVRAAAQHRVPSTLVPKCPAPTRIRSTGFVVVVVVVLARGYNRHGNSILLHHVHFKEVGMPSGCGPASVRRASIGPGRRSLRS